jgi:PAS domain S-box-containing protein
MILEASSPATLRRQLILAVIVHAALVACLATVFLGLNLHLMSVTAWVDHTDQILARTYRLQAMVADQASPVRGYLLNGRPKFFRTARAPSQPFESALNGLARLVIDNPEQQWRLSVLRANLAKLNRYVLTMIELDGRGGNMPRGTDNFAAEEALVDKIRQRLAEFIEVEETLRDRRSRTARLTTQVTAGAGLVITLLFGAMLGAITRRRLLRIARIYEKALAIAHQHAEPLRRLAAIVESSDDAIIGENLDGTVTSWNASAERLFGYTAGEVVGRPITQLIPGGRDDVQQILAGVRAGRVTRHETRRQRKDGTVVDVSLSISPVRDADGRIVGASIIAHDITDRKRAEERLAYQAIHDALMGLPNQGQLRERVEQIIASGRVADAAFALLVVDLDGFKEINDTFGHAYGDALLQQLRPRLKDAVRESDVIARIGGDEFGIVLPGGE